MQQHAGLKCVGPAQRARLPAAGVPHAQQPADQGGHGAHRQRCHHRGAAPRHVTQPTTLQLDARLHLQLGHLAFHHAGLTPHPPVRQYLHHQRSGRGVLRAVLQGTPGTGPQAQTDRFQQLRLSVWSTDFDGETVPYSHQSIRQARDWPCHSRTRHPVSVPVSLQRV